MVKEGAERRRGGCPPSLKGIAAVFRSRQHLHRGVVDPDPDIWHQRCLRRWRRDGGGQKQGAAGRSRSLRRRRSERRGQWGGEEGSQRDAPAAARAAGRGRDPRRRAAPARARPGPRRPRRRRGAAARRPGRRAASAEAPAGGSGSGRGRGRRRRACRRRPGGFRVRVRVRRRRVSADMHQTCEACCVVKRRATRAQENGAQAAARAPWCPSSSSSAGRSRARVSAR